MIRLSVQPHALIDTHCDEPWQCGIHSPVALAQLGKDVIASDQCKLRWSSMENIPVPLTRSFHFPGLNTGGLLLSQSVWGQMNISLLFTVKQR